MSFEFALKCFSCGAEISDSKRMCDNCAKAMIGRLAEASAKKEREKLTKGSWQPPEGAPTGAVKSWKPQKKNQKVIKGGLTKANPTDSTGTPPKENP